MALYKGGQLIAGVADPTGNIDNVTITQNASSKIQTVAVKNQNTSGSILKTWSGTRAQYDAITTKDPTTLYNVTEDIDSSITFPTRNIGQIISSTLPLTDAGLHLLDGSLLSGSGIYADFVQYIAGLVSSYPDLFETEANWQTAVSTYGVCGKFVYDSTNNTVRLPKITGILEGTTDLTALGDLVEAGLPNITSDGTIGVGVSSSSSSSSALYVSGNSIDVYGSGSYTDKALYFDASRSSSIYGNSSTVQPQTIKCYYYIVVATSAKTNIEVDIDEIATDLNNKVNSSDLSEVQCVVETFVDGTSWYRVYSDKWCEQGGYLTASSSSNLDVQITFIKPFVDNNYTFIQFKDMSSNATVSGYYLASTNKTGTGITIWNNSSYVYGTYWIASGYIL